MNAAESAPQWEAHAAGDSGAARLRALLVIPTGEGKNSYIFSRRQASMLIAAGVDARMFFVESRMSPKLVSKELFRLRREIREFRPHVVHAQYGSVNAFLSMLAGGAPLAITFRGSDLNPVPSCNRLRIALGHFFSQVAAWRASVVICVSEELYTRLWWAQRKATVIIGGVNLDRFSPVSREQARLVLGWNHDRPIVLFNAGKHPKIKRLDLAQAAIEEARKSMPGLDMVVAKGDLEPDAMPLYYSAADCLLITSDYEGSPTVLKEAMACNLPVVSVAVGDVNQRLRGVTRSRIVSRNACELGAAIVEILQSKERSNGRAHVQDLCELAEAGRIRDLYRSLVPEGARA